MKSCLRLTRLTFLGLALIAVLISSCKSGGGGGTPGASTPTGKNSVAYSVVSSAPTGSCPNGGITVDAGIDTNSNGVLDSSEITSTQYVCNGANGTSGTNGAGVAISLISLPSGSMGCANGGTNVCAGPDANADGTPDSISSCKAVCNGSDGANGANGNTMPIANAGPDQKVAAARVMVSLNGSGSSDPDGNSLTYSWIITERPVGSLAALSNSVVSNPTFTPDKAGKYTISLTVNDGQLNSLPDAVVVRAGMPAPDTGQTRWYSTTFGDDADYTINPMSYTDNGDGTILDNVTGLTWQKCSMGQSGMDCATGTAATYNWYQASGTYEVTYNPTTINVCGSLNLAGTGWRLPTYYELMTIEDFGRHHPAIDTTYFPETMSYYCSSTTFADPYYAGAVTFSDGSASSSAKAATTYVRCVR